MANGGLLRDPQRYLTDPSAQRQLGVQLLVLAVLLAVSAYSHFLHRRASTKTQSQTHQPGSHGRLHNNDDETAGAHEETVAEVDRLVVYPIKSCAGCVVGERGRAMRLDRKGFQYDRRWMVVRPTRRSVSEGQGSANGGTKGEGEPVKWEKQSLREEPRLTLVRPEIVEEEDGRAVLRLSISDRAPQQDAAARCAIEVPLRPTRAMLDRWQAVCDIEMWGDVADGRIVEMDARYAGPFSGSPSQWLSEFLGYEAVLLQFDDAARGPRAPFPIWKPPASSAAWPEARRAALGGPTRIEFQDEYPLLVSTVESLAAVQAQIQTAVLDETKLRSLDRAHWRTASNDEADDISLKMTAFRPNVVLRSRPGTRGFPPFSEDSWETIWIGPASASEHEQEGRGSSSDISACLHLVARCKRCRLTTVDPVTAKQDKNVPLAMLRETRYRRSEAKKAGPCFGMYAVPEAMADEAINDELDGQEHEQRYGVLTVGDAVRVRWRPYALDDEVDRKRE